MSGREAVYGLLSALGLVIPWLFNVQYVAQGGSLVDIAAFFAPARASPSQGASFNGLKGRDREATLFQ